MLVHGRCGPSLALVGTLVVIEILPVESDREVQLLALEALVDHVPGVLAHVLFRVVAREEIHAYLEACRTGILVILLELSVGSVAPDVLFRIVVVVVVSYIAAQDNEFTARTLDLLEIDVALVLGDIDTEHGLGGLVISLEIRELEHRIAVNEV